MTHNLKPCINFCQLRIQRNHTCKSLCFSDLGGGKLGGRELLARGRKKRGGGGRGVVKPGAVDFIAEERDSVLSEGGS